LIFIVRLRPDFPPAKVQIQVRPTFRPNDPVVPLIHAAMILRHATLEVARRGARLIRARRRKR
jgi:hypothetical protein